MALRKLNKNDVLGFDLPSDDALFSATDIMLKESFPEAFTQCVVASKQSTSLSEDVVDYIDSVLPACEGDLEHCLRMASCVFGIPVYEVREIFMDR